MTKATTRLAALAILSLALALPAWAHAGRGSLGRPGVSRPIPPRNAHPRGLLGQLIFPCQADCADSAETCGETADSTALACILSACTAEVDAAQAACGADRSSDECLSAASALADCADACLETHADELGTCRDTLVDCRTACESDE